MMELHGSTGPPLMAPMLDAFRAAAERVHCHAPVLPLVSNVTGAALTQAPEAAYWVEHVSAPVRFADGMTTLVKGLGCTAVLELGAGQARAVGGIGEAAGFSANSCPDLSGTARAMILRASP